MRLAVGYVPIGGETSVVPAADLSATDGALIRHGARLEVSAVTTASSDARDRRAVELLAHYSYFDGAVPRVAPFRAWASSRISGSEGNPIRFTVPLHDVQKILLTIALEAGVPPGGATRREALSIDATHSSTLPLTLSLQGEQGTVRLARGFYVIVPVVEGDSELRWHEWVVRKVKGRWAVVDSQGLAASFEHFLIRIDYATS